MSAQKAHLVASPNEFNCLFGRYEHAHAAIRIWYPVEVKICDRFERQLMIARMDSCLKARIPSLILRCVPLLRIRRHDDLLPAAYI